MFAWETGGCGNGVEEGRRSPEGSALDYLDYTVSAAFFQMAERQPAPVPENSPVRKFVR